ncbi:MAG: amidophosphoribosyltransferase, partial [Candidatus Eremiobacteraeota bacterium]|nr:amidophosphoribosyltransferase [Candidatus Eremiobacteraeota bacterium]
RSTLSPSTTLQATSDSEVMAKLIVETPGTMAERIDSVIRRARGAYSIVLCTDDELYAFRDPWGVRPLSLGKFPEGGYAVASETCALSTIGAEFVREVQAGEIVRIRKDGVLESYHVPVEERKALCMFEYIYFARPDSQLNGESIYMARYRMGQQLAKEHPIDADVVMAIPDSAVPGGIGYADGSGLPYIEGLIKNRYIGRTFINPDQKIRSRGVHMKFNPVVENLRGRRVVVVDDSIVRGTTTPRIVQLLREAGALEVHVRVTSPPIKHPCYHGVDMATYDELIAANFTVEEIREKIGADTLGYLSVEGLTKATKRKDTEMCLGCLNGSYPNLPAAFTPRILEKVPTPLSS